MRPSRRTIARWALRLLLAAVVAAVAYVAVIVFPSPLFAHEATFGTYRVYSDEVIPPGFDRVIDDLDRRLHAMEHAPPEASQRIYLCGPRSYAMFAFLLRKDPDSLAIGVSAANGSFVSLERVRLFAARNRGRFRHSRFEGNLAEVVAHEVAHFNSVHALGYRAHLGQPMWKSEGWAEYQANLAAIRADPGYDLVRRVDLLLDDRVWGRGSGIARSLWESQLLVEYLGEIEGYRLEDLVEETVTETGTRRRMLAWYRGATGG